MTAHDWTLDKYIELLCAAHESGYKIQTIQQHLAKPISPAIIIRHDIDRFPKNAIRMARAEYKNNVHSTYYVRMTPTVFKKSLVEELSRLGHEVGYHYEVLSKTCGNIHQSIALFNKELEELRRYTPVLTAAAHGSPLSKWNNHVIWKHYTPEDFNLLGEAYESIDYGRIAYFTDTGRAWDSDKTNLRDRINSSTYKHPSPHTTDDLINLIRSQALPNICIQTHPERWSYNTFTRIRSSTLDKITNIIKRAIHRKRHGK